MGLWQDIQGAANKTWTDFRDMTVQVVTLGLVHKKPITPNYSAQQSGSSHVFKASTAPHQAIYGQMRVSGLKYEIGSSGVNNEYIHIIVVLAGHEVDSIGNVIVNNLLIDGVAASKLERDSIAKFKNNIRVSRHLGGINQVADQDLMAEIPAWTAKHVGSGIAYVYLRIKYNAALFPNGIDNIKCDVRGKKVFDPRTGNVAWSDNWALCVRDYLTASFGMGLTNNEINDAFTIASANISEEIIPTANSGLQNRYTINGIVDLSKKPLDNIKKMLTAGAGHIVPIMEGQCRIIAGSYATPTQTIGINDLRGELTYAPHPSIRSLFNVVTGQYAGADSSWIKTQYPQVGDQAAIQSDGREIRKVIDLPYCTDHERCQRLSKMVLNQHRSGAVLKLPCKATVKDIAAMDVVFVDIPTLFGASPRTFRVIDFTSNADLTIDLLLEADNASDYAWQQTDATPFVPVPPLLTNTSPTIVQPGIPLRVNGLELAGQGNNTMFTGGDAHFVWRNATVYDVQSIGSEIFGAGSGGFDAWFKGYDITILDASGTVIHKDFTRNSSYDFTFLKNAYLINGPYRNFTIEVRIQGQQNQLSQAARLSVSNPAPALPTALSLVPSFDSIHITFKKPLDLDFAGVQVHMSTTSGFTISAATLVQDTNTNNIVLSGLTSGTTYYIRLATYDEFGLSGTNTTSEQAVTCTKVSGMSIKPGSLDYITLAPAIASNIQAVPSISSTATTALTNAAGAQSTADSAQATATTALNATTSIDGQLAASYSVRLDVNGYVTGFGLTNGGNTGLSSPSIFSVVADSFRFVNAAGTKSAAAFAVDAAGNAEFSGNLKAAGGSFSGAITAGAGSVIDGAYIGNATIGTLHLKSNSVASIAYASNKALPIRIGYIETVIDLSTISVPETTTMYAIFNYAIHATTPSSAALSTVTIQVKDVNTGVLLAEQPWAPMVDHRIIGPASMGFSFTITKGSWSWLRATVLVETGSTMTNITCDAYMQVARFLR